MLLCRVQPQIIYIVYCADTPRVVGAGGPHLAAIGVACTGNFIVLQPQENSDSSLLSLTNKCHLFTRPFIYVVNINVEWPRRLPVFYMRESVVCVITNQSHLSILGLHQYSKIGLQTILEYWCSRILSRYRHVILRFVWSMPVVRRRWLLQPRPAGAAASLPDCPPYLPCMSRRGAGTRSSRHAPDARIRAHLLLVPLLFNLTNFRMLREFCS